MREMIIGEANRKTVRQASAATDPVAVHVHDFPDPDILGAIEAFEPEVNS